MKQLTVRYQPDSVEAFYEGKILYRWSNPVFARQQIAEIQLKGWTIIREGV